MRRAMFAANWKMFKTSQEAEYFANSLLNNPLPEVADIVICSSALSIPALSTVVGGEKQVQLGAQNFYPAEEGAFTGEVSPAMLNEFGVKYVIVGHSERRTIFGETDKLINQKLKMALKWKLIPILCVGENLEEREIGMTTEKVSIQLKRDLDDLTAEEISGLVIAYEPIWAIGTGKNASADDAVEVINMIRSRINEITGANVGDTVQVLYGGSVKPANVEDYMKHTTIDGALIGGAALKPDSFREIIEKGLEARG